MNDLLEKLNRLPPHIKEEFIKAGLLVKQIGGNQTIWEIVESVVQYDNDVCPDELYQNGSFQAPPF